MKRPPSLQPRWLLPVLTRKRECRTTLRWHHKIPHTRISRDGIVIDNSGHESHSLPESIVTARSIRPLNNSNLKRALACAKTRFASIARGYSALVCCLQPVDRVNNRISRRLVRYLADQLGTRPTKHVIKDMNKVIEVDFLPRASERETFELGLTSVPFGTHDMRRVLIADNDRDITHLVKVLLEKTGRYLVLEENDGARAHLSARNFRPDLILLDIVMRETDGAEIAAQLRSDPQLRNTPIIFLTALVTRAEARTGLHIDGHPFLAKPINIQELINAIEGHLPGRAKAFG
jgi:CheY-like chemotaxis protein